MSTFMSDGAATHIVNGTAFGEESDPHLIAYRTKGKTYIIASNGKQSDSMNPDDLIAITRHRQIVPLAINVHPDFVAEVEALFA